VGPSARISKIEPQVFAKFDYEDADQVRPPSAVNFPQGTRAGSFSVLFRTTQKPVVS
jgi:hypothetical protein